MKLHQEWPSVERLDLHLPAHNIVVFHPMDDAIEHLLPSSTSKLLQWFVLNQRDESARLWRYIDIPEHFTWNVADRIWQRRVTNCMKVARLPSVSAYNAELQALRMILHVARGAQSFIDLLTFNGHTHSTFRDAARAAGLLEDDGEAMSMFYEMTRVGVSVSTLREQFCLILMHCAPTNAVELFNMFSQDLMYEDVNEQSSRETLLDLDRIMRTSYGKSLRDDQFGFVLESTADSDIFLPPIAGINANQLLLERLRVLLLAVVF